MTAADSDTPFAGLDPDRVIDALESVGLDCDGRVLALNSYENRVFRVGIHDEAAVVAKFYRPGRWSDEAILEEHAFAAELDAQEIPVVPALSHPGGGTLNRHAGFRFALYPNRPGRAPELDDEDTLRWLGRFLARLHAGGARRPFRARPELDIERLGSEPVAFLRDSALLPADLREPYAGVARAALERI